MLDERAEKLYGMIYTEASNVRAVTTRIVQEKIHKKTYRNRMPRKT